MHGIITVGLLGCLVGCAGGEDDSELTESTTPTPPTTTSPPTTTTTTPGSTQIKSLVIESAESVPAEPPFSSTDCALRIRVRNTANQTNGFQLVYNGFNAAGAGIAQTLIGGNLPANSTTQTMTSPWITPAQGTVPCAQIASFRLDQNSSVVLF